MKLRVTRRESGEIEYGIIYGVIALVAVIVAGCLPILDLMPSCVFRSLTGLPCPTCGATRSLVHVARGDIDGALILNPLFTFLLLASLGTMILQLLLRAFGKRKVSLDLERSEGTALRYLAAALFVVNWCYLAMRL